MNTPRESREMLEPPIGWCFHRPRDCRNKLVKAQIGRNSNEHFFRKVLGKKSVIGKSCLAQNEAVMLERRLISMSSSQI